MLHFVRLRVLVYMQEHFLKVVDGTACRGASLAVGDTLGTLMRIVLLIVVEIVGDSIKLSQLQTLRSR